VWYSLPHSLVWDILGVANQMDCGTGMPTRYEEGRPMMEGRYEIREGCRLWFFLARRIEGLVETLVVLVCPGPFFRSIM
jgi:hypothetical protein